MEASVFGGETFSISTEDAESVTNVLAAFENHKEEMMRILLRKFLRICLRNSNLFLEQLSWYLNSVEREKTTKEGF